MAKRRLSEVRTRDVYVSIYEARTEVQAVEVGDEEALPGSVMLERLELRGGVGNVDALDDTIDDLDDPARKGFARGWIDDGGIRQEIALWSSLDPGLQRELRQAEQKATSQRRVGGGRQPRLERLGRVDGT